jgi:hypothetical protein
VLEEGTGGSSCTVRWTGKVTSAFEHGYSGAATQFGFLNLASIRQLRLKVRGDGRTYRLQFPMNRQLNTTHLEEDNCSSRGKSFTCGDGQGGWTELTLDIKSLKQQGWGKRWDFDPVDVSQLQLQSVGTPISSFQCDFQISWTN